MDKKIILPAVLLVSLITTMGIGVASASPNMYSHDSGIIEKISTRFNLNKDEVAKVFDEEFKSHQQDRQEKINVKIDEAVKNGNITIDLANQLKSKLQNIASLREEIRFNNKETSKEELRTATQDMHTWMKENNIPKNLIMEGHMKHRGHNFNK